MKKTSKYFSLILASLVLLSCSDQLSDVQKKSFVKFYGSYQIDVGSDVGLLSSGGYAMVGNMIPDSLSKMALILTDEYGNQTGESPYYFGDESKSQGISLIALDDGFLIGGQVYDSTGSSDIFLVRTDLDAVEMPETNRLKLAGNESLFHIIQKTDEGYVFAGKRSGIGQEDMWIAMVNDNGEITDELVSSNPSDDEANYLYNTDNGYICACSYNDGAMAGRDFFLVYIDEECNVMDTKSMGTEYHDYAKCIVRFQDKYLFMGTTENTLTGFNQIALYTFELDGNSIRNVEELATFSVQNPDLEIQNADLTGERCVVTSNGDIAIVGSIEVNEDRDILLLIVDQEGKVLRDVEGNIEGLIPFGDMGTQSGSSIRRTPEGGLVLTGTNRLEGNSVITLVKTNARGQL